MRSCVRACVSSAARFRIEKFVSFLIVVRATAFRPSRGFRFANDPQCAHHLPRNSSTTATESLLFTNAIHIIPHIIINNTVWPRAISSRTLPIPPVPISLHHQPPTIYQNILSRSRCSDVVLYTLLRDDGFCDNPGFRWYRSTRVKTTKGNRTKHKLINFSLQREREEI